MMIIIITIITGQPATIAEHIHGVNVIGYDLTVLWVFRNYDGGHIDNSQQVEPGNVNPGLINHGLLIRGVLLQ